MPQVYRFLDTGAQDAALNMAIDEAVLLCHLRGQAPPTLRVFRWTQPAISVGRFQQAEREIDLLRCQQEGVTLVRRPTGGRAVYHRDEFTYSVVSGRACGIPAGIVAAYAYLAQGLIAALGQLGIPAELSQGRVSRQSSAACFASSTQADLTSGGLKLIGSAQVWKEEALLQQGSLPLDDRSAEFYSLLRFPDEAARREALERYRGITTPLHTCAPHIGRDEIALALCAGFRAALHIDIEPAAMSAQEWALARQLLAEKYSQLTWQVERVRVIEQGSGRTSGPAAHLP
ncbi:MAG TPA: biotin/lipoate A/B protein ligase family protein [Ktedonobacteraceae bacterium]|jgi:lipoate-protein ligase A